MTDIYLQRLRDYGRTWDPKDPEQRMPSEQFWVALYEWLNGCGYLLRPRYHPNWVPSWRGTKKWPDSCEDGIVKLGDRGRLLDAVHIPDRRPVALKMIFKSKHPYEAEIGLFLASKPLTTNPKNHCVPILEILEVPDFDNDMIILVMPRLRPCDDPRFETIGEAVEFFRQVFEGLQFMHKNLVSHRDCSARNIMMDPTKLYPDGYHPVYTFRNHDNSGYAKHYTRTERPPKYYLIDFGLSRRYHPGDDPPLALPIRGGDKSVPEFQGEKVYEPSNPFPTDIYYLGNMVKEDFIDAAFGFEFMSPLVADMRQDDPSKRPTIDEVVTRFAPIYLSLNTAFLRTRVVQHKEEDPLRWWRNSVHFFRRLRFTLQRIPPVPPSAKASLLADVEVSSDKFTLDTERKGGEMRMADLSQSKNIGVPYIT